MTDHFEPNEPRMEISLVAVNAERQPVVFAKEGEVFASSRDVAAYFGKRHDDVLKAVRALISKKPDWGLRNFAETPYLEPQNGQTYKSFDMDRKGFTLLAMGFTGAKALEWQIKYIDAFDTMEAELRARDIAPINYLDPKNILGFVGALQAEVAKKDEIIAEQGGRLQKLGRIEAAENSYCFRDAAKVLKVRPKELEALLLSRQWVYRRVSGPMIGYQSKVQSGHLEHTTHPYVRADGSHGESVQCRITAKGLVALADILARGMH